MTRTAIVRVSRSLVIVACLLLGAPSWGQVACTTDAECSDGDGCNGVELCVLGVCQPGTPVVCTALDQCHVAGTCDPATGICSNPPAADGTLCSDGTACTTNDSCQTGTCTATAVVCTALDQCHVAGTCDPATGICSNPPAADGTLCSDGTACTTNDSCQAGTCTGTAVVCTALDQCHVAGTCDPATGICSNPPAADGTPCSDGTACTTNDSCQAGTCTANAVVCLALDQCHVAGTCDPTTGICSNPPVADGISCDDGLFCMVGETCNAGVCGAAFARDCSAFANQCNTGICNEAADACQAQPANQGLGCNDGDTCTAGDLCNAGVCAGGAIVACASPRIVVANNGAATATVIRSSDLAIEGVAPTGAAPEGVAITRDTSIAYITNNASDSVSVIDLPTRSLVTTIPVGVGPGGIAITPDDQTVYVANSVSDSISTISTASNSVFGTIQLNPLATPPPFNPEGLAVTPNGAFLYVTNYSRNMVSVFRTADNLLLTQVPVGRRPRGVAVTPNGAFVYVANAGDNNVHVIRVLDNLSIGTISVGAEPFGIAFTHDGTLAYVSNSLSNTVSKITTADRRLVGSIPVASFPTGISVKTTGDRVYVASMGANRVNVIDVPSNLVVGAVIVGSAPVGLAVTPMVVLEIAGAAAPSTVTPGGQVTFTFTYGNSGAKTAAGVTLRASIPTTASFVSASPGGSLNGSNVEWTIGSLPAGTSGQVSFTLAAANPLPPNSQIASTATITDAQGVSDQASAFTLVNSNPQYSLAKVEDSDPVAAGATLTYTITYANNASANAEGEGVSIADTYDPNFTFLYSVPAPIPGTNNQWAIGRLPVGASGTISVTGAVRRPLQNGTILQNVVTLRDTFNSQLIANQNTVVISSPALGIALADDRDPVPAAAELTYTINYTNTGNENAAGVVLTTSYDPNVVFVRATPAPDLGRTDRWTIGNLNVGASGVIAVTVRVAGVLPNGTVLTAQAAITDGGTSFASSVQNTTVSSSPALNVSMADAPDPIAPSDTLTYAITYSNTGTDVAPASRVVVAYDSGITFLSAIPPPSTLNNQWDVGNIPVGGGGTIIISARVDALLGSILNSQAVISDAAGFSASSAANTTVQVTPVLTLSVTESTDPVAAGDLLTYTVHYGNSGNTPATNTALGAVYDSNVTFVSASPPPDFGTTQQWTLGTVTAGTTGEIVVTVRVSSPLPNGLIVNMLAVVAADGGQVASASQNTTVQSAPAVAVSKSDGADPTPPGGTLTYTIAYANPGNENTSGVVITEAYDPSVTFVSAVPPPDLGTNNRWTIGALSGGASSSIQVTVAVPQAPNGTPLTNTVTIRDIAGRNAAATEGTTISSPTFSLDVTDTLDPVSSDQRVEFNIDYGNVSGVTQSGVVVRAVYAPDFVVEETVPLPDAGTADAWTVGQLTSGQTGRIVVRGFFARAAAGSLAQTRCQISNFGGAAFASETTAVRPEPMTLRRLRLKRSGFGDSWILRARFVVPPGFDATGQPIELSVLGPGGEAHTNALILPELIEVRTGRLKFLGDLPGNGSVSMRVQAPPTGNWGISVRCRGNGIIPPFPAEDSFLVGLRLGTQSLSASGDFRSLIPGAVRRFP